MKPPLMNVIWNVATSNPSLASCPTGENKHLLRDYLGQEFRWEKLGGWEMPLCELVEGRVLRFAFIPVEVLYKKAHGNMNYY